MSLFQPNRRHSGAWILTFSGRRLYLHDPSPADYCIEDVAHGCALETRWGSQTPEPFSVAQHCVLVVRILEDLFRQQDPLVLLAGLLHDASEAILKDKRALLAYKRLEKRHEMAIAARFGLPPSLPGIVKAADVCAAATERRDLFPHRERRMQLRGPTHPEKLTAWDWRRAEREFLAAYARLFAAAGGRRAAVPGPALLGRP